MGQEFKMLLLSFEDCVIVLGLVWLTTLHVIHTHGHLHPSILKSLLSQEQLLHTLEPIHENKAPGQRAHISHIEVLESESLLKH